MIDITGNYIHLFETQSEYETERTTNYKEPWVSYTKGTDTVVYNKTMNEIPLTFEITSDGNIYWKATSTAYTKTIEYKKNDGEWTSITSAKGSSAPSISVVSGDTVQFRGDNNSYASGTTYYGYASNTFSSSTCEFKVYGNIMSLINSTGFTNLTTLESTHTFTSLFIYCRRLTDASKLILPATTLTDYCYLEMFSGCWELRTSPELPATTLAVYCYGNMFQDCTSLATAPSILPATTLAQKCYNSMFYSCRSLTTAPTLPATTLANYCYDSMFKNCTSLTTAPTLPATTLANYCYSSMFYGCSSLTTAPALPATTLADYCYYYMFYDCTSLATAPSILPATELTPSCYSSMFYYCSSLTTAPALPATTLADNCYQYMFRSCTGLTTAPDLLANVTAYNSYEGMFSGCTNLSYIKCTCFDTMSGDTLNWVRGVAASGTFVRHPVMNWRIGSYDFNGIPSGWEIIDSFDYTDASQPLTMYMPIKSIGFSWLTKNSSFNTTIEYKINDGEWQSLTSAPSSSAVVIETNPGDIVQLRGDNQRYGTSTSSYNYFVHKITGYTQETKYLSFNGNMMSLIDSTGFTTATTLQGAYTFSHFFSYYNASYKICHVNLPATTLADYCYNAMFYGSYIMHAPELPATTLTDSCYYQMFGSCSGLTSLPELPATTLARNCYRGMFSSCDWLTTVPSNYLPATTLTDSCYYQMFAYSRNLTTAPTLPATTLANYCYYGMFYACGSLTTAPALPATTLADNCYAAMFFNCTSLTTAPALPATTLANSCYYYMFVGCTGLTTVPTLPATTLANSCYYYMFAGCTSLTTVPSNYLPVTTLADYCYQDMFSGCTGLTTAPALPATALTSSCYSSMFAGCTSLTTVPTLPATALTSSCYSSMFQGCTGLTTAPDLPATQLIEYCYYRMFSGCTNLNYIKCLATDISANGCTSSWVSGVAASGTFVKNAAMSSWTTGNDGIPTNWTVQDA